MQTRSKRNITVVEDPNEAHIIKRMKQSYGRAQQQEAFKELLKLMGANGGKLLYGAMDKLVKTFNKNGFTAVTQDNFHGPRKKYRVHCKQLLWGGGHPHRSFDIYFLDRCNLRIFL